jgi:Na+/H+-dicarboxylate symporter
MNRLFTYFIVAAMVLGVLAGWLMHLTLTADQAQSAADGLSVVTDIFLRLIKMIIAPWSSRPWWPGSPTWATPPRSAASA